MTRLFVFDEALAEARRAARRYERARAGLGQAFIDEFERVQGRIAANPHAFAVHPVPEVPERMFKAFFRQFPYTAFCMERPTAVWIVAVAHHSRRPNYWLGGIRSASASKP